MKKTNHERMIHFLSEAAACFAKACGQSATACQEIGKQVANRLESLPEIPVKKQP